MVLATAWQRHTKVHFDLTDLTDRELEERAAAIADKRSSDATGRELAEPQFRRLFVKPVTRLLQPKFDAVKISLFQLDELGVFVIICTQFRLKLASPLGQHLEQGRDRAVFLDQFRTRQLPEVGELRFLECEVLHQLSELLVLLGELALA